MLQPASSLTPSLEPAPDWEAVADGSTAAVAALRLMLRGFGRVVVAYSGGSDSAFLLKIATDELGSNAVGLTAIGESLAPGERDGARAVAEAIGAHHVELESHEIDNPDYTANPANRCYFCKTELYEIAGREARRLGIDVVLSGTNADELGDYRPGLTAASEHGVRHPMAEVGLTKQQIRAWSRRLGVPTWDKPQTPCLASRLPYGTPVTRERLARIARAEQAVRDAGLRIFRVRHHEDVARLEVGAAEFPLLLDPEVRARIEAGVREAGFVFVTVDLAPFRSGRLNEAAGLVPLRSAR